jgi:pimeloyl-ACP methyl ester carboxylesterase
VGEKEPIVRYPQQIESLVAAGNDPVATAANLAELRAAISSLGFRPSMRLHREELRRLTVPTLVIWGEHDPVGAVEVGQATAKLIPDARLEVLPAGSPRSCCRTSRRGRRQPAGPARRRATPTRPPPTWP